MPPGPDAVQRWAAAHAATVTAAPRPPAAGHHTGARPHPAPQAIPVVLAAVAETRTWRTEGRAMGVDVYVAPDGQALLAAGEENGAVRIWDPGTGELLRTLTRHSSGVPSVDFGHDRDGRPLLATGGRDGTVRIWDPQSGELVLGSPISIAGGTLTEVGVVSWGYSADGRPLLAIGTSNGTWIWDSQTREAVPVGPATERSIYTASWARGHHAELLLASAGSDQTARIFDVNTGQTRNVLHGHVGAIRTVAWMRHADESFMLVTVGVTEPGSGVGETKIYLWKEGRDGTFTAEAVDLSQGALRMVSWVPLPDGRALLAGNSDGSLFILDGSTLGLLHEQPTDFRGCGVHNLGWAIRPDGGLMLCGTSHPDRIHVWDINLDPPIPVPAPSRRDRVTTPGQAPARTGQQGTLVLPPEDVTPRFQLDRDLPNTYSVRCAVRADGEIIAATWHGDDRLRIWAISTGALLHTLTAQSRNGLEFAWGHTPDGRLLLATASRDGPEIQIWDSGAWQLVTTRVHPPNSRDRHGVDHLAWLYDRDGRTLLASGGTYDGTVYVQDPESGVIVRSFTGHRNYVNAISEGWLADGRRRLVTGDWNAPARLWDPDTGELLLEFAVPANNESASAMWAASWGRGPDGRPVIAISSQDGTVRIWDPETGDALRTLIESDGGIHSVVGSAQPGWPSVLVTSVINEAARIWDPGTGAELARLSHGSGALQGIDVALAPDGELLLVIAADSDPDDPGPVRVWRIATRGEDADGASSGPDGSLGAHQAGWLAERLLRLGSGGLWPPLGLMADLMTLTNPAVTVAPQAGSQAHADDRALGHVSRPAAALHDTRLAVLGGEPDFCRLRDLAAGQPGWAPAARVAFAALLAGALDIPEQYTPPADVDPATLLGALVGILGARPGVAVSTPVQAATTRPWRTPLADLRKAAADITDQTVTLLRILGPDACATDPLLPLRLAHYIPQLPVLSQRELRLLARAGGRHVSDSRVAAAGTLAYSPGTVGITRSGPPTRLLPTQLALPHDVLVTRLAENQLLYRQHRTPTPPALEPVTIILDTTPPTLGPAGQALRLAAHLITTTLWEHDRYPSLITLTHPGAATDLRTSADLVSVWASATLEDPVPALAVALGTAAAIGQPVVFCTHHHTAPADYVPGPSTRLLTTHQPPERPPRPSASPWHAHLPPKPTQQELMTAIARLLIPGTADDAEAPGSDGGS
jgi:WD40 repeat protein